MSEEKKGSAFEAFLNASERAGLSAQEVVNRAQALERFLHVYENVSFYADMSAADYDGILRDAEGYDDQSHPVPTHKLWQDLKELADGFIAGNENIGANQGMNSFDLNIRAFSVELLSHVPIPTNAPEIVDKYCSSELELFNFIADHIDLEGKSVLTENEVRFVRARLLEDSSVPFHHNEGDQSHLENDGKDSPSL